MDGPAYNLTFEEGKSFAPEDKCQMYDIDWAQQCPGAVKFEDLEKCFDEKKLNQSELIPCENGYESVFDKSQVHIIKYRFKSRLTDTGEDARLVHRRKSPKVDTLFSSLFFEASERRV